MILICFVSTGKLTCHTISKRFIQVRAEVDLEPHNIHNSLTHSHLGADYQSQSTFLPALRQSEETREL